MAANVHQDVERVLFAEEDLSRRVREMGAQISADYVGKDLLVVSILRGAAIFAADLAPYDHRHADRRAGRHSEFGYQQKLSYEARSARNGGRAVCMALSGRDA